MRHQRQHEGTWSRARLDAWLDGLLNGYMSDPGWALAVKPVRDFLDTAGVREALLVLVNDGVDLNDLWDFKCVPSLLGQSIHRQWNPMFRRLKDTQPSVHRMAKDLAKLLRPLAESAWPPLPPLPCPTRRSRPLTLKEAITILDAIREAFTVSKKGEPQSWADTLIATELELTRQRGRPATIRANMVQKMLVDECTHSTGRPHHEEVGILVSAIYGVQRASQAAAERQYRRLKKKRPEATVTPHLKRFVPDDES